MGSFARYVYRWMFVGHKEVPMNRHVYYYSDSAPGHSSSRYCRMRSYMLCPNSSYLSMFDMRVDELAARGFTYAESVKIFNDEVGAEQCTTP